MNFLEKQPWTVSRALATVREALKAAEVSYDSIDLIRFGTGAVYRIHPNDVVVRVTRPDVDSDAVFKEEALRAWLEDRGFPVLTPLEKNQQPLLVNESYVTFWRFLPPAERKADIKDLALLIKELHRVGDLADRSELHKIGIRTFNPFIQIDDYFVAVENDKTLAWADLVLLKEWRDLLEDRLRAEAQQSNYSKLGFGLIHGDAHLGNCYLTNDGPILLDLDFACWGPREWDFIPAVLEVRRFGSDKDVYYQFSNSYGADILDWRGFETLVLIRELMITGWRLSVESAGAVHQESENRLLYWRKAETPPLWRPF